MSGLGWPDGPATWNQVYMLRKLTLEVLNELVPDDHGFTEGTASKEIKRLLQLKKDQDAA
jgi:hypothetical protein